MNKEEKMDEILLNRIASLENQVKELKTKKIKKPKITKAIKKGWNWWWRGPDPTGITVFLSIVLLIVWSQLKQHCLIKSSTNELR